MTVPRTPSPGASRYVKKYRIAVRVSQPGSEPREGEFLLFPGDGAGGRPETLLELLNSPRTVIPFIQANSSDILLLTRTNIDWVVVGRGAVEASVFPPGYVASAERRVDLRMIDESHLRATIQWNAGDGSIRLSDFLNGPDVFIPARTTFGTVLVNKLRVRESLVEESAERSAAGDSAAAAGKPGPAAR